MTKKIKIPVVNKQSGSVPCEECEWCHKVIVDWTGKVLCEYHENATDCIEHLAKELASAQNRIQTLEWDLVDKISTLEKAIEQLQYGGRY